MTAELEAAYQAVAEARERVQSQRALIEGLRHHNHYTGDAEKVLRGYEAKLAEAEAALEQASQKGAA